MMIWKYEGTWPRDFENFIFLARAVRLVGRAAFPDGWSDSDPLQEPQPDFRGKTREAHQRRHAFIRHLLMADSKEWQVPFQFPVHPPENNRPIEEWQTRGAQLLREHKATTDAARSRCRRAEQMLLNWLIAGEVAAAIRPHEGGSLERIPNSYWNSENVSSRFRTGKLFSDAPFRPTDTNDASEASWIFVDSVGLNRLLSKLSSLPSVSHKEERLAYVSDILEFTIDMAVKHREYLKKQLKIRALEDLIEPDFIDTFGNEINKSGSIKAVAKVLRDFGAQNGTTSPFRGTDQSAKIRPVRLLPPSSIKPTLELPPAIEEAAEQPR